MPTFNLKLDLLAFLIAMFPFVRCTIGPGIPLSILAFSFFLFFFAPSTSVLTILIHPVLYTAEEETDSINNNTGSLEISAETMDTFRNSLLSQTYTLSTHLSLL